MTKYITWWVGEHLIFNERRGRGVGGEGGGGDRGMWRQSRGIAFWLRFGRDSI